MVKTRLEVAENEAWGSVDSVKALLFQSVLLNLYKILYYGFYSAYGLAWPSPNF